MVTTKDIAAAAGVSQTAVSAVLNGQGKQRRICEKTAQKILEAAKRLGYRRNLAAQELRRGKSNAIGILLPAPVDNIYGYLTGSLGPLLEKHGYLSSFAFWEDFNGQISATESILCRCPSGIITVEPQHIPHDIKIPVVSLITEDPLFDLVNFDGKDIFTQAIDHLHSLGHRKIAYPYFSSTPHRYKELTRHFISELKHRELSPEWVCSIKSASAIMSRSNLPLLSKILADWFESCKERPSAMVLPTDMLAIYFMREMTRRGYRIPDDLSVTGCDDIPLTEAVTPTLTSFGEIPGKSLADCLVTCLLTRMEHPEAPRMIHHVKRQLIPRESTRSL